MQLPVLIEPVGNNGFRARSGEPLPLSAEGATREEALANLRRMLASRLIGGAEMTSVDVGCNEHPLARFAGIYSPDDPMIAEWQQAVEEYRRQKDAEDDVQ